MAATFAVVQHETGRLALNGARDDIKTPADLDGMIYADFGTNLARTLVSTIIEDASGTGDFEMATLGPSAYEALAAGRARGRAWGIAGPAVPVVVSMCKLR